MTTPKLTGETITEAQLREVLARAIICKDHGLERYAQVALSESKIIANIRAEARAICADSLNAGMNQVLAVHRHDDDANDRTSFASRGFSSRSSAHVTAGVRVAGTKVQIEIGGQDQIAALRELETRLMLAIADIRATVAELESAS